MVGQIIGVWITGMVGLAMVILGYLIWIKEKMSLLHDYHINKVSPGNRKAFCTMSGVGVLVIGISLVITAVMLGFTDSAASFICFAVGFVVGLSMLILAGLRYNR